MKTFSEIEKQYLDEHHESYVAFTRLLVMLSVAFITLLAASVNVSDSPLFKASIACQLFSLLFGLVVQHQIMTGPIHHLRQAQSAQDLARPKDNHGGSEAVSTRRPPSKLNQLSYKLQLWSFALSFLLMSWYLIF